MESKHILLFFMMNNLPQCTFGARCRRREPTHFLELSHPQSVIESLVQFYQNAALEAQTSTTSLCPHNYPSRDTTKIGNNIVVKCNVYCKVLREPTRFPLSNQHVEFSNIQNTKSNKRKSIEVIELDGTELGTIQENQNRRNTEVNVNMNSTFHVKEEQHLCIDLESDSEDNLNNVNNSSNLSLTKNKVTKPKATYAMDQSFINNSGINNQHDASQVSERSYRNSLSSNTFESNTFESNTFESNTFESNTFESNYLPSFNDFKNQIDELDITSSIDRIKMSDIFNELHGELIESAHFTSSCELHWYASQTISCKMAK
ncbi:hypothetical protein BLOT_004494 [Blomia tropicalis]|nr:hypothetical protein BLOT_004494 [Blomia tropicalis]